MDKRNFQLVVLLIGAFVFIGLCLYPPTQEYRRTFEWNRQTKQAKTGQAWTGRSRRAMWDKADGQPWQVDATRLGLELAVVIAVTLAMAYALVPLLYSYAEGQAGRPLIGRPAPPTSPRPARPVASGPKEDNSKPAQQD